MGRSKSKHKRKKHQRSIALKRRETRKKAAAAKTITS